MQASLGTDAPPSSASTNADADKLVVRLVLAGLHEHPCVDRSAAAMLPSQNRQLNTLWIRGL